MQTTNPDKLIRGLVTGTIRRAIQESVACVIVLVAFGAILRNSEPGTPTYYGCLLILVAAGFIAGVVWSFALSYKLLQKHPVSDVGFWREAFLSQSRLLRYVPLWYLTPMAPGIALFCAPHGTGELPALLLLSPIIVAVFSIATWINRAAATQLESQAAQL